MGASDIFFEEVIYLLILKTCPPLVQKHKPAAPKHPLHLPGRAQLQHSNPIQNKPALAVPHPSPQHSLCSPLWLPQYPLQHLATCSITQTVDPPPTTVTSKDGQCKGPPPSADSPATTRPIQTRKHDCIPSVSLYQILQLPAQQQCGSNPARRFLTEVNIWEIILAGPLGGSPPLGFKWYHANFQVHSIMQVKSHVGCKVSPEWRCL